MNTSPLLRRCVIVAGAAASLMYQVVSLAAEPLKVGFVYFDGIGSAGWTYQHELGRQQMEKTLGARVTSIKVENVNGPDSGRVMREMVADGHKLIFTTGFDYMEPTLKVAQDNPAATFMNATGFKQSTNVGSYNARFYEGRYLSGIVAGRMSKSGVAGYVAAFPIPEVVQGINAFTRGMRSVNPAAQVKVIMINAWFDPSKERETAMTLMDQGADVVTQHTNSSAVVQAAEARGVYSIGYHSDMSKFGPKTFLTATTHEWGAYYTEIARRVIDGKWKPTNDWMGVKDGVVKLAPLGTAVPAPIRAEVAKATDLIAAGKLHPFAGPVVDQDGVQRVAAGQSMSDDAMQKMDFYVQGVAAKFPRR